MLQLKLDRPLAVFDIESGVAVVFDGLHKTETNRLALNTRTWAYEHSEDETG